MTPTSVGVIQQAYTMFDPTGLQLIAAYIHIPYIPRVPAFGMWRRSEADSYVAWIAKSIVLSAKSSSAHINMKYI